MNIKFALPFPVTVTVEYYEADNTRFNYGMGEKKSYTQKGAYVQTHYQAWGDLIVMDVIDTEGCVIRPKHFPQTYMEIYELLRAGKLKPYKEGSDNG